jgi:hypothetical protein
MTNMSESKAQNAWKNFSPHNHARSNKHMTSRPSLEYAAFRHSFFILTILLIFATPWLFADDAMRKAADTKAAAVEMQTPILHSNLESSPSWKAGDPISFQNGKVVFDIQERLRYEIRENNFDFNSRGNALSITDDAFLHNRLRIGMRLKPNDWVNAYLQTQDSREIESKRPDDPGFFGSEGDQYFSLRQANVTIANYKEKPYGVTLGRQELSYGDERLIGAFDWNNIGRVFDGVRARYQQPQWNIEGFAVMPVSQYTAHFDVPDTEDRFFGAYYQTSYIPKQITELYAFFRNKTSIDSGFPTGGFNLGTDKAGIQVGTQAGDYTTIGSRIKSVPGKLGPWDYGMEIAGQLGTLISNSSDTNVPDATTSRKDLRAWAAHVMGGYTFPGKERPRLGVEYNYASGDSDPADGTSESFQNLFPTNHKFYGFMDVFAWRNMHNARAQANITLFTKLALQADYHAFWIADGSDAWFRANATTPVRGVGTGAARRDIADKFAGQELDLTFTYPVAKWWRLHGGYSHFFAGDYLHDTGAASDADFTYLISTFVF